MGVVGEGEWGCEPSAPCFILVNDEYGNITGFMRAVTECQRLTELMESAARPMILTIGETLEGVVRESAA